MKIKKIISLLLAVILTFGIATYDLPFRKTTIQSYLCSILLSAA